MNKILLFLLCLLLSIGAFGASLNDISIMQYNGTFYQPTPVTALNSGILGLNGSGVRGLRTTITGMVSISSTNFVGGGAGLTALTAANITASTTVGRNLLNLTNPSAITFLRVNADNSVDALSASAFRTAIGAGTGTGDVVGPASATDGAFALFDTTSGKLIKNSSAPGTGVMTALAVNVGSAGAFVTFNGAGGTPLSITLTNGTGLPISSGVSGLGTGVATALAVNIGSAGATLVQNGALGTPSSGDASNLTNAVAYGLKSATTTVSVSAATAPTSGQALVATSGTTATWQTVSGSGDVLGPATNSDDFIPQWNGINSKTLKNGLATAAGGAGASDSGKLPKFSVNGYLQASGFTAYDSLGTTWTFIHSDHIHFHQASGGWNGELNKATLSADRDWTFPDKDGTVAMTSDITSPVKAWVNFDGTTAANVSGTYSQTGTTVTVTLTAHGHITGHVVFLDFTTGTATDAVFTITVIDANTYTVTRGSATTSGNVTENRRAITGSSGIHSVAFVSTGIYYVNFTTAMSDAGYAFQPVAGVVGSVRTVSPNFSAAPTAQACTWRVTTSDFSTVSNVAYNYCAFFR